MVSFSLADLLIILSFFSILLAIGFWANRKGANEYSDFLLSGRKVGLWLFVMTNVSTWYGGILGVGEFSYNNGLLNWTTQGMPYYIFAVLFAFLFAEKIRNASLFTIPDRLEAIYGRKVSILSALLILLLVSPAPYLLMIANLIRLIFGTDLFVSLLIAALLSASYLIKGGYKSDLYTDVFQFFVMFAGFILILIVSFQTFGGYDYISRSVPSEHLSLSGGAPAGYIIVWFLIAMWTFADPGFHQRCYAAADGKTAKYGILVSVIFMVFFDFLTTTTGLYSRAALPGLENPVNAFPLYAEKILGSGAKGIFYAGLLATIISTSNSFLFLSGTTFSKDLLLKLKRNSKESELINYTRYGIIITSLLAVVISYYIQSVISIWYFIGSVSVPALIMLLFGAYYDKLRVEPKFALTEITGAFVTSVAWVFIRESQAMASLSFIEPMLVGLTVALLIHLAGIITRNLGRINTKDV